jgi:hypothetical protein
MVFLRARPCTPSLRQLRVLNPNPIIAARTIGTSPRLNKMTEDKDGNKRSNGNEPHQYQAGSSTDRKEDEWKHRAPYKIHDKAENFDVKWRGKCHCGAVQYELSREKPLASKYCHCTTCQRLHGVRSPRSIRGHSSSD